jgi:uncharacterized protein (TIGR03435 family)
MESPLPPDLAVEGLPEWTRTERFDIEGKAENTSTVRQAQLIEMLETLLVERFQLSFHKEIRTVSGYALLQSKDGPKVKPAVAERNNGRADAQVGTYILPKASIEMLATFLTRRLRMPVQDRTGLDGFYQIDLRWTPGDNEFSSASGPNGPLPGTFVPRGIAPPDPNRASLFTAIEEQLGLRLESQKVQTDVIVIDRLEKPPQ